MSGEGWCCAAVVAADTLHYQSERPDAGWGCGYRNCQMLLSSLLNQPVCHLTFTAH